MTADPPIAKPGCQDICGNVSIPYPFGIGDGCYHSLLYAITCNTSQSPPKPFLNQINLEVAEITLDTMATKIVVVKTPLQRTCGIQDVNISSIDLRGTPYLFYRELNVLLVGGCGASALLVSRSNNMLGGCTTACDRSHVVTKQCLGRGCCSIDLPSSLDFYRVNIFNFGKGADDCTKTMLINGTSIVKEVLDPSLSKVAVVPTVLQWSPGNITMPSDDKNKYCYPAQGPPGNYECYCKSGYYGNPYLPYGCQVPKGCKGCKQECSKVGNRYICASNNGSNSHDDPTKLQLLLIIMLLCGGSVGGLILCFGSMYCINHYIGKRKLNKSKENFFQQNGGLLLKQRISLNQGSNDTTKIFTAEELKVATNNYSKHNILRQESHGTMYKGMLPNKQVVAIKNSKIIDETQVEQFIEEVFILTQINHPNVVKLLGCCLETEVPLLVYEFVPNRSLFDLIHNDRASWLSWKDCLGVAAEVANAISYLHSAASMSIIHGDIKSSNILLDDSCNAKLSDFGVSGLAPIDQSQVFTLVRGTFGYLDPEFFQTTHMSEKSDVYSFGVILVELLTRRKPFVWESGLEDRNLAMHFISSMKRKHFFDILEPRLMEEASQEELISIAKLVEQCLSVKGEDRPSMKDVARELEGLKKQVKPLWSNQGNNESVHAMA